MSGEDTSLPAAVGRSGLPAEGRAVPSAGERGVPAVGGLGALRLGFATLAVAFGGFGVWAATAPLDSAAVAQGEVVVESYPKKVEHQDGGLVKAILVHDGDRVVAGQPLVELDATAVRARYRQLEAQYWDDLTARARLVSERQDLDRVDFSALPATDYPQLAAMERAQVNLFEARKRSVDGQVAVLRKRIIQFQRQADALAVEQRSVDTQLELIGEEVATVKHLLARGLGIKPRLLALERDAAQLQGQRDDFGARIAQVEQGIASTELEMANVSYHHLEEVANDLKEVEADIRKVVQEKYAIGDSLRRTVIRAPQAGVVVGLKVHTVGAVIEPGREIMEIVPQHTPLVVDARVDPSDIDRVVVGRPAQVRFLTFLPGLTPPARGKVIRVSADLMRDERTGQGYYLTRVALDPESLAKLPSPPVPGMQTDVLITTGEHTALDYFIAPLARAMSLAMREK